MLSTPDPVTAQLPPLPVDIVIPIYNASADLATCVESVLRCTSPATFRLVLIDDASTDRGVAALLSRLEREGPCELLVLRNPANRGFSFTVNRGLAASADRDVVLLNSDTIVTECWLDKLRRCVASDPAIGTATPFSNNSTITSFPRFAAEAELSTLPPIEVVNQAMEEAAVPSYPNLPTAIGFCMYVRRRLIDAIGYFDTATFGRGYGEDNDYSLRAAKAGFRNVACDDTFIAHTGSRSFGPDRFALSEANRAKLERLHPEGPAALAGFLADNPVRAIVVLAACRLEAVARPHLPGVLHVLHHDPGGGTRRHVTDLADAASDRVRASVLMVGVDAWTLEADLGRRGRVECVLRRRAGEAWLDVLRDVVDFLAIDVLHVHHLLGARGELVRAIADLGAPYGVTLHDHHFACPTIVMLDAAGRHCGAVTDARRCADCLARLPDHSHRDIVAWRDDSAAFLAGARFVIAPSQSLVATMRRYFPLASARVIPHGSDADRVRSAGVPPRPEGAPTAAEAPVVGILGAIGPAKGARTIERLVQRTRERRLRLRWVVVGYLDVPRTAYPARDADGVLTIHGPYRREELSELLDRYGVRVVLFPSAAPESFSYALSEAWALGRPAVVPPLGALAERVAATGAGWVLDDASDVDGLLDVLVRIMAPDESGEVATRGLRAQLVAGSTVRQMADATLAAYPETAIRDAAPAPPPLRTRSRMLDGLLGAEGATFAPPPPSTFARRPLPGRNDRCPCGSGLRYRHCCGTVDAAGADRRPVEVVLAEGVRRHHAGLVDDAERFYRSVLAREPAQPVALHFLGVARWQAGDWRVAEALLRRSLAARPGDADFRSNLGLMLQSLGRHDEAVAEFRRALQVRSDHLPATNNLGLSLMRLRDFDAAGECFRRALALAPGFSEARWNLEVALRSQPSDG